MAVLFQAGSACADLYPAPQTGAILNVTTLSEHDDGVCSTDDCTLLEALDAANANPDLNTIDFAPGLSGTITTLRTPNGLAVTNPVWIRGPGPRVLSISGSGAARLFFNTASNVTISGLTLDAGFVSGGNGGAIFNAAGSLTIEECTISNNVASGDDLAGRGGAIYNASGASLTLSRSTAQSNSAGSFGGAVYNEGRLSVTNCTFTANIATRGGGIASRFSGGTNSATIRNCTITANTATSASGGLGDGGGGYYAEGSAQQEHFVNNLIAGNINSANPDVAGNYTSDGHNLIGSVGQSLGFRGPDDQTGTNAKPLNPRLDDSLKNNGGPTDTVALLADSPAREAGDDGFAQGIDQRRYYCNGVHDIGAFEFGGFVPTALANISTRLRVETGDNVLIGGFIIAGSQRKKVILRAMGTSLPFADKLVNPRLELYSGDTVLEANDDWDASPNKPAIVASTIPPDNAFESAIVRTLAPGAYTAIVRGTNNGTGIGVIEAYDLDQAADSKFANISTRGLLQGGDNLLIAGTIVLGQVAQKVIVRALGPSLSVPSNLGNPVLELRDHNGALVAQNDNWKDNPAKQTIIDNALAPVDDLESAIVTTLAPNGAQYTAILRGAGGATGIAVVEIYALN